jgi:hypothetical protein
MMINSGVIPGKRLVALPKKNQSQKQQQLNRLMPSGSRSAVKIRLFDTFCVCLWMLNNKFA